VLEGVVDETGMPDSSCYKELIACKIVLLRGFLISPAPALSREIRYRTDRLKTKNKDKEFISTMIKDTRWPALLLIVLRGIQLFLSVLVLGLSSYLISIVPLW
jgi:ABC-type Fe3+-siderophore transport system permease subunit